MIHWSQSWGPKVHNTLQPPDRGRGCVPPAPCSAANVLDGHLYV